MKEAHLNVRHFKLVNGEDIIALCTVKNDDNYIVERPVLVANNILGGFQFTPWFPFSENKGFKVMKNMIVNHVLVADDVRDAYIDFALKLNERRAPVPATKSDTEVLRELEEQLLDRYEDDREYYEMDKKKERTLH